MTPTTTSNSDKRVLILDRLRGCAIFRIFSHSLGNLSCRKQRALAADSYYSMYVIEHEKKLRSYRTLLRFVQRGCLV